MSIKINSPQLAALRTEIEKIIGEMHSHSKFIKLQELISIKCKEHISVSTLERIWGYSTRNVENVSVKTLDIISNFVDADGWTMFCESWRRSVTREMIWISPVISSVFVVIHWRSIPHTGPEEPFV